MKLKNYFLSGLLMAGFGTAFAQTQSFNFTGGIQTFTVPCGVDTVFIQTWGAQGGSGANGNSIAGATLGGSGGLGGYAEGLLAVTPGDVLNIFVGGQGATPTGGFNGGANGGSQNAGGGGGATDVRVGGTAESDRVITAGGGGGGGRGGCESQVAIAGGNGGSGGGGVGADGQDAPTSGGSAGGGKGGNFGALQGAAGSAGVGCSGFLGSPGTTATTGTGGTGGAGQSCCCFSFGSIPAGGGGGGGQLGGGGGGGGSAGTTGCSGNDKGAGGGGGGGSSYVGGVINGATNNGIWLGDGMVTISWTVPVPPAHTINGSLTMCEGDTAVYTIPADQYSTFYTWTVPSGMTFVSGQNTTSITTVGAAAGIYTLYVYGVNGTCSLNGPTDSLMVTVYPSPAAVAAASPSTICIGNSVGLSSADSSLSYVWNPGALTGSTVIVTPTSTTTYTMTATNSFGCTSESNVTVTVNPLPTVTFTTPGTVCSADAPLTLNGSPAGGTYSGPGVSAGVFTPANAGVGTHNIVYTYTDPNGCANTASSTITVDACAGISGVVGGSTIVISPNPAVEILNVTWGPQADVNTIRIMDVTGRVVITEAVNGGNKKELDVTSLPAGNYSVSVEGANSKSNFTFVKQ